MTNTNSLENIIKAEGMLVSSDLHGNYNLIESGLRYAQKNNLAYVLNGDVVNDYRFLGLAKEIGIQSPSEIQEDYLSKNLSRKDYEALKLNQSASVYGIEGILSQVPEGQRAEFEKNLKSALDYSNTELFQKRIKGVVENMIADKGEEISQNGFKLRALYQVFMDEEARKFADELNKYSDVKVLFNKGNHENRFFVEQVRQYLNKKEQILDVAEYDGVYEIVQGTGDRMKVLGMTNCRQLMPYLNEIFAPEELEQLYGHVGIEKKYDGKGLDVLLSHGQIGKPMGLKNPINVPYLDSAKKLSLEAKLTVEGHIHNKYDGKNEFGRDMVRAAGDEAVVIRKKGDSLDKEWVRIGNDYNGGHSNPIYYSPDYYKMRMEQLIKEYEMMMQQQQSSTNAGSEGNSTSRAA